MIGHPLVYFESSGAFLISIMQDTAVQQAPLPLTREERLNLGRTLDPRGHHIHLALAAAFAFVLPLGMVPVAKDILLAGLVFFSLLRLPKIYRCYATLFLDPLLWLMLAWPAWLTLSFLWSPAPDQGFEEIRMIRTYLILSALWPVAYHFRIIAMAFIIGCATIVLIQIGQMIGLAGLELDLRGRADAAMQPILAAALLVTAAMWLLSGACLWKGRRAIFMAIGLVIIMVGLALTGSRGPWLSFVMASGLLILSAFTLAPWSRRRIMTLGAIGIIAGAGFVTLDITALDGKFTTPVQNRVKEAFQERTASLAGQETPLGGWQHTPIGFRLLAWDASRDVFLEHPLLGIGAGGLSSELRQHWWLTPVDAEAENVPVSERHLNPHSMYLQTLSQTGIIGLILLVLPMILVLCRLVPRIHDPIYFGAAFALIAWAAGATFDGYQMMTSMMGVLMLIYLASIVTGSNKQEERTT